MATNFVQPGDVVTILAPANAASGDIVVSGRIFGVATKTVLSGAALELKTGGVWDFAKLNAASMSMAQGANAYWDATNLKVVTNATGNTLVGVAMAAVGNTDVIVRVRLNSDF